MKKSFVYLVIALALATMLCGCGMNADNGVINESPRPTDTIGSNSSMIPETSPTIIPDAKTTSDHTSTTSNPQVGASDEAVASPNATASTKSADNKDR